MNPALKQYLVLHKTNLNPNWPRTLDTPYSRPATGLLIMANDLEHCKTLAIAHLVVTAQCEVQDGDLADYHVFLLENSLCTL